MKLCVTVMYQCVYGKLTPIMLRIVYLAEPPYGITYVYWYGSPTDDTYAIILFPMFEKDKPIEFQHKHSNLLPQRQ